MYWVKVGVACFKNINVYTKVLAMTIYKLNILVLVQLQITFMLHTSALIFGGLGQLADPFLVSYFPTLQSILLQLIFNVFLV